LKNISDLSTHIDVPQRIAWKTCAHKVETTCLTFNRDGEIIYTGGADGIVKGWAVKDGKELC
jgi:WD40 repeat protein